MKALNKSNNKKEQSNKNTNKNLLYNIKSNYILKEIFDNLPKIKSLYIIKYNKKIQNKLDIDINYYKHFSIIEILIIPKKNPKGQFIKILNDEDKQYYHIYFNDSKEEIKRYYINEKDEITKIKMMIEHKVKSLYKLFYSCESIESITFKNYYRNNIK